MKKIILVVVSAIIVSVVLTVIGIVNTLPLLTLLRFGLLSVPIPDVALAYFQNIPSAGVIDWISMGIQTVLSVCCSIGLFILLVSVVNTFTELDSHFKKIYYVFFFFLIILPFLLVLVSAFLHFPVRMVLLILGSIISASSAAITVIIKKILPETDINPDREFLYS